MNCGNRFSVGGVGSGQGNTSCVEHESKNAPNRGTGHDIADIPSLGTTSWPPASTWRHRVSGSASPAVAAEAGVCSGEEAVPEGGRQRERSAERKIMPTAREDCRMHVQQ